MAYNPVTGLGLTQTRRVSVGLRNPLKQPHSSDSIWNLPIGAGAIYVYAGIQQAQALAGLFADPDILILTPTAPVTPVYYNSDAWGGGSRCSPQGGVLFSAPIPADFVVPGNRAAGNPDGSTPNYSTAILDSDGHTIIQGQPFARCVAGGPATIWWTDKTMGRRQEDLYGTGETGSHGGAMMAALGGTIRLGEFAGRKIPHAMKLNLHEVNYSNQFGGMRWPAIAADSGYSGGYSGSIPAVRMGSLLALKPDFNIALLETEPGRILAKCFMDYGAYIVDSAGWSVYGIPIERSPEGHVRYEFAREFGFEIDLGDQNHPWARDLDKIFTSLHVVDNWDYGTWQRVSASAGKEGAGTGAPRQPWAAPLK